MLACLLIALAKTTTQSSFGWEDLSIARDGEVLAGMPQGRGGTIHISIFDPTADYYEPSAVTGRLAQMNSFIGTAHTKGYRVAGVINCFRWRGFERTVDAPKLMEYQNTNAVNRQPALDLVCPFSAAVQKTILGFVSDLGAAKLPLDAIVIRYQFPRSPIIAFGMDARLNYIKATSVDPIDIAFPEDSSDQEATKFLAWRLTQSHTFLEQFLTAVKKAVSKVPVLMRGDPSWAYRPVNLRGAQLDDWPFALDHRLVDGVVVRTNADEDPSNSYLEEFAGTIASLDRSTTIWLEGKQADANFLSNLASRLNARGFSTRADVRMDTNK